MSSRILFLFAVAYFFASLTAYGQKKEISETEYFSAMSKSSDTSEQHFPRRVTVVRSEWKTEIKSATKTQIQEFPNSDEYRNRVKTVDPKGKVTFDEYVRIGNSFYCKSGKSRWRKAESSCEPMTLSTGPTAESQEFSVESLPTDNANRIFRMYRTHTWPKTSKGIGYFMEQLFTVDRRGLLLRIEIKEGVVGVKHLTAHQVEVYDYDLPLTKIQAPII